MRDRQEGFFQSQVERSRKSSDRSSIGDSANPKPYQNGSGLHGGPLDFFVAVYIWVIYSRFQQPHNPEGDERRLMLLRRISVPAFRQLQTLLQARIWETSLYWRRTLPIYLEFLGGIWINLSIKALGSATKLTAASDHLEALVNTYLRLLRTKEKEEEEKEEEEEEEENDSDREPGANIFMGTCLIDSLSDSDALLLLVEVVNKLTGFTTRDYLSDPRDRSPLLVLKRTGRRVTIT